MSTDLFDSLFERARSAAFTDDSHRRGWEAVRTAAVLRKGGQLDKALALLDDIVDRFRYEDVQRAAYTCAVAIHSDRGHPGVGIAVGRGVWSRDPDPELGNALVRAYWDRFEQTGDLADRDAWIAFKDELEAVLETAA